jgi:hypothetical protein
VVVVLEKPIPSEIKATGVLLSLSIVANEWRLRLKHKSISNPRFFTDTVKHPIMVALKAHAVGFHFSSRLSYG